MKRRWLDDELSHHWQIWPEENHMIQSKRGATRLGFAVLLKFFQFEGRFPYGPHEVPIQPVTFIANQVGVNPSEWNSYPWEGRSVKYHRAEVRDWCGFREVTLTDLDDFKRWLVKDAISQEHREDRLLETLLQRCRNLRIEPPAPDHTHRLIISAIQEHETRFCEEIFRRLKPAMLDRMAVLLQPQSHEESQPEWTTWQFLKAEPGKAGIESVREASVRLKLVHEVGLPTDIFKSIPPKLVERYAKRAAVEEPFELRRHDNPLQFTLVAAFLHRRSEELIDHMVDLLIETVHKMGKKAERRIDDSLGEKLQKAPSKMVKLYQMAKASVNSPKGIVEEVIFPTAPEQWLLALIREVEAGSGYKGKVRWALQRSYRAHYRRMLPELLNNLEFRCTDTTHQPLMEALEVLKTNLTHKGSTYPKNIKVPIQGVVSSAWMPLVVEKEGAIPKINRIAYEISVLKELREQLRCREIWVVGSRRYRDPEEDLPRDFEGKKAAYYNALDVPLDAKTFTASLREEMIQHLKALNDDMPSNAKAKIILKKDGSRISISPFDPQVEPENLTMLKQEITDRWSGTSLVDVLKETDLRVDFTQFLRSGTERSHMEKATLQRRLLLCLFGLGTNTGIKSMASGPEDDYKDLLYIRRRFFSIEGLRQAITQVVNATLDVRLPQIWGEATTACSSDSKQFGAWDQNLLTEWHLRYGGRGVMVYWHVEKNAACIYSQFKRVSSSEAAAMIEGVLRHCTEMEVDRQYVDSHGQNLVAFAFCRFLGFELMPRLKGISRQKLYKAEAGQIFPNLNPIMASRAINWELDRGTTRCHGETCGGTEAGNGGCRESPSPVHTEQHSAPGLQGPH